MLEEFNKALKYVNKDPLKAIQKFKAFNRRHGECKETYLNMGVAYKNLGKFKECETVLLKANDPTIPLSDGKFLKRYPLALNNLGLLEYCYEQDEKSIEYYKELIKAGLAVDETYWNLSIVLLRRFCSLKEKDLNTCWKMYEYRFKRINAEKLKNRKKDLKAWNYIDKVDSIVVMMEQGMGDTFMFGRYLKHLENYANKIWIQCTPDVAVVFKDKYLTCLDPSETDATHGVPMCSLGRIVDGIPDGEWLADRYVEKKWDGELKIGCVWEGNKIHVNNINRSINVRYFEKLKKFGKLFTIGKGKPHVGFEHLPCEDWDDTIRQLEKLDVVITVDTSIAHMCGALGKPCWVLMPKMDTDFRWGDSSMGHENIWYRSVSVIRNPNSWDVVFKDVEKLLGDILNVGSKQK